MSLDKPADKNNTCQGCYFHDRRHSPTVCSVGKELDAGNKDTCKDEDNVAFVWQEVKDE